jgi:hypothetical protein
MNCRTRCLSSNLHKENWEIDSAVCRPSKSKAHEPMVSPFNHSGACREWSPQ